jgi:uncharacterized membrane protein
VKNEAQPLRHQFIKVMELIYKIALVVHSLSGMTALLAGFAAIISKKGKNIHRKSGVLFFYSMLLVCATAFYISILKSNTFLLHIGIFTFFMIYSGYRSVKNKSLKPIISDWLILMIAFVNGLWMIASMHIILMVFGLIGCLLAVSDFRLFIQIIQHKEISKNQWLLRHLGMMLGAYIATSTAFIVVNIQTMDFAWIPWLVPTAIGTPMIFYCTRKYKSKSEIAS